MTAIETTTIGHRAAEDLRRKNEAIVAALETCDKDTYHSVISILEEAGLLP